jgi:DNA uptake protein ComE-like DNA-binding protein
MRAHFLLPLSIFLAACDPSDSGETADRLSLSPVEIDAVLELVNDPATDVAVLDVEVGLDRRAAEHIIVARNGADGVYPSSDDHPFDTLEELETVKYVGEFAMGSLRDYVNDHPAPSGALVDGVEFTGTESSAVLWGVNQATLEELDHEVALASDTARSIVENAPYDSMDELAAVPNVGKTTLTQLRAYSAVWTDISALAGTFDGVTFEARDAADALEIANHSTFEQLTAGGVYSTGARAIIGSRPYDDLAEVASVSGVGPSTMQALKSM